MDNNPIPEGIELTKAIAEFVFPDATSIKKQNASPSNVIVITPNIVVSVDYLNNWNDLMPLVIEHKEEMLKYQTYSNNELTINEWVSLIELFDKDPQLALAQCLYLVLKAKQRKVSDGRSI